LNSFHVRPKDAGILPSDARSLRFLVNIYRKLTL